MADQAEYQRRFDFRRQKLDGFYKDLDNIYQELRNVPQDATSEGRQKQFIVDRLRDVERRMNAFIQDLYD